MATATRSPLIEQAEKIDRLAQQLSNGQLLEKALRLAGSDSVWRGALRDGFMGWIAHALDFWMRNQLAEGVRLVARSLFNRAADIERAQQAMAAGQVGVVGPGIPAPLNYAPGTPPSYGSIGGPGVVPEMNGQEVRGLSHLLLATADEVLNFGRTVEAALDPPPAPPPPPGAPPTVSPVPPDADAAVGFPQAYLAIAEQLRNAASDLARRADQWLLGEDASVPGMASVDLSIVDRAAGGAAAIATGADAAADQARTPAVPTATPEDQVPQPPVEEQQRDAEALARDYPPDKVLDDPRELQKLAAELEKHEGHEAFAARFVEKFGAKNVVAVPRALQAWQNGWQKGRTVGPNQRALPYGKPQPEPSKEDIEGVLYGFSGTLATASRSDDFRQDVEDKILATKDPLALSWLLSDHDAHFDADFLVDAFEHGAKDVIIKEASLSGIGSPYGTTESPLELGTGKLSTDPKVAVLNAISRNEEAAMRIADIEFKPPLKLHFGLRPDVEVKNIVKLLYQGGSTDAGYGDNGAALGRMLDTAHRGFCDSGNVDGAKRLVDQILKGATNDKDVARAQEDLRRIGLRQPMDEHGSAEALDKVRHNPKHPAREALLAMAADSEKAAKDFAQAAAKAGANSKVDPDKNPDLKSLYGTEAAWDNVAKVQAQDTPDARNLAETVTEQAVNGVARGQELTDAGRRGLAKAMTANVGGFATSVTLYDKPSDSPDMDPTAGEIHVSLDELVACMANLMKDEQARRTIELGAGNLTASWAAKTANQELDALLGRPHDRNAVKEVGRQADELGVYLCGMVAATGKAAENKAQAAIDALAGMRLGVDLVFMGLDFAKSFVPGGGVLLTQSAKWLFDQTADKAEGGFGVEGMPEPLQGGLRGFLEKDITSKEDAAKLEAKVDVRTTHVMVKQLVRDTMAGSMITGALGRPPEERDQLLENLQIRANTDDGTELHGLAALEEIGLLNSDGQFSIPPAGTPGYTRYSDWLGHEAPAFAETIDDMGSETADHFAGCMVTHLDVKQTGP